MVFGSVGGGLMVLNNFAIMRDTLTWSLAWHVMSCLGLSCHWPCFRLGIVCHLKSDARLHYNFAVGVNVQCGWCGAT